MAAAATSEIVIECGFCWRTNEALEDPRVLPCTHVHCSGCLNAYFQLHHIVQCPLPDCRETFDVTIANLPSHKAKKDAIICCDICTKKGKDNQPAVIYCRYCSKKFCVKHQESHDDVNDEHSTISIEKYIHQASRVEEKTCSQHNDTPDNAGCKECLKVICVECLDDLDTCITVEKREIELEILPGADMSIDIEGLTPSATLTKSLTLLKSVDVLTYPCSVYHYKGSTYVGLCNQIAASIDSTYQLTSSGRYFTGYPVGITGYQDKIYYLVYGTPYQVIVLDLSGNQITKWNHTDSSNVGCHTKLAIVSDQVVVPDRQNKRLSVYSLTGQTIKQIAVPQLSDYYLAMCAVGDNSVVISEYGSSKVFMVGIGSGEVMWTCSDIANPQGVTCYRGRHVYIASYSNSKIYILDIKTGAVLAELSDTAIGSNTHILDLHISDDTLVVALYSNSKVLYYKMNK